MKRNLCVWIILLLSLCLTSCGGGQAAVPTEMPDLLEVFRADSASGDTADDEDADSWYEDNEDADSWYEELWDDSTDGLPDVPPEENSVPARTPSADADGGTLPEDGSYTSKEDVALYLHLYARLPDNFITKQQARALGWNGGSLEPYAPGKCIGGDYFGNYEGILPRDRSYHECDIDTLGADSRGAKRIVYSDDGLIYYTSDHYNTFTLLYGAE